MKSPQITPDPEENKEETPLIPQLYAVTGGKLPPGFNWLSGLKPGTSFLCRPFPKQGEPKRPFMEEYHVIAQFQHATKILTNLNEDIWLVVDPIGFCGIMELVEVILEGERHEEV